MHTIEEGDGWRMMLVVDEVMYDDSYIDTWEDTSDAEKVQFKKELWDRIEVEGVWGLVGEVECKACGSWECIDAVGGFIGEDWKGSGYEDDIKASCKAAAEARK